MARPGLWLAVALCISVPWLGACEDRNPRDQFYDELDRLLGMRPAKREARRPVVSAGWPRTLEGLGEVSGVSVDPHGDPVILHRGPRHWDAGAFNSTTHYQRRAEGPIAVDTVLTLDAHTGQLKRSWGGGLFYLPHGLTVDPRGHVWVTDVALHQALKFAPGSPEPLIEVGTRFEPGVGHYHLCQPTAVAVAPEPSAEVFIADGYCNSRIVVINSKGRYLNQLPRFDVFASTGNEFLSLQVPHGLALLPHRDLLCIADRDNMRVVCPRAGLVGRTPPTPPSTIQAPDMGRVFAVTETGGLLYAVNGPTSPRIPVRGFTLDTDNESVVDRWGAEEGLETPHALAACPNGSALYLSELSPPRVWKFELRPLPHF
ncbi:peptidyl-alpha-hydroxyglycine alpha-amidating lyase 2-like [Schistocerca nitens]|uniref:peptidyl-alpha-hydroxyglycine alpha-amidating lyase 2-like n=1 Tax=Schistocerca nitens TaxID=7011 RepID=UPI0021180A2D|nr:peptidyl-alpha-hydroxyglycine alpha-amidating lyase 2-like [Schistocerca nitens]